VIPEEHRPVPVYARAAYRGEVAEDWCKLTPWLRPHVDHVVERIRTLAVEG
jgi:hypothetical protein